MNPRKTSSIALSAALLLSVSLAGGVVVLSGCGGASSKASASETGRAVISITWPERTRLIPVASNSIKVTFYQGAVAVATQTVARPSTGNTSTLTFSGLPAGNLSVTAVALPNADGTGNPQANTAVTASITIGQTAQISMTMASTIASLAITPATTSVAPGAAVPLTATAYDGSSVVVLTSPSTISWTSSDSGVAVVSAAGEVTGIAGGTATITATESESGKTATATVTVTSGSTGSALVDLANAYINSLTTAQKTATVVTSSAANAAKWSNLPAQPGTGGTTSLRNGVAYSTLTATQKAAWDALVSTALGSSGYAQLQKVRAADDYLGTLNSGYSGSNEYVAFVGTPSTSGTWMLQVGGHHNAHNLYYNGNTLLSTTPYHIAVEPQSFTSSGTSYTPLQTQRDSMYNLINSLTSTQLTSAKLSSSFSDIYLGPGKDARSYFPTGTTGRGILTSNLTTAQKQLLKTAIAAWVSTSPNSSSYQALYENELDQTYVAYSGTTGFTSQGDYVRIDGPHVWIEFACQNGVVLSGIHFHTIWRDRVTDYNAAFGF
ncbi:MAG: DUF3500 domain-containing protein [Armatimonas sp.]